MSSSSSSFVGRSVERNDETFVGSRRIFVKNVRIFGATKKKSERSVHKVEWRRSIKDLKEFTFMLHTPRKMMIIFHSREPPKNFSIEGDHENINSISISHSSSAIVYIFHVLSSIISYIYNFFVLLYSHFRSSAIETEFFYSALGASALQSKFIRRSSRASREAAAKETRNQLQSSFAPLWLGQSNQIQFSCSW